MTQTAILIIIEPGLLEAQAKLLIDSIHRYVMPKRPVDVFTFSPRKDRKPSAQTMRHLEHKVSAHYNQDLNLKYDHFPLANGLFASAFFEQQHPEYDHILLTDTDTVFINPLPDQVFEHNTLWVSAADNKGVGSNGPGDANDPFWQQMFDLFGLPLQEPGIQTNVRTELIRPYHNSGFVLSNQIQGLYQQWYEDFDVLMSSDIRPDFVGRDGTNFGFFEQLVLSVTAARLGDQVRYFPRAVNHPLPFRPYLQSQGVDFSLQDLVHLHYHKWFQHPGFLEHIFTAEEMNTDVIRWLNLYLPFEPTISGPFKC